MIRLLKLVALCVHRKWATPLEEKVFILSKRKLPIRTNSKLEYYFLEAFVSCEDINIFDNYYIFCNNYLLIL